MLKVTHGASIITNAAPVRRNLKGGLPRKPPGINVQKTCLFTNLELQIMQALWDRGAISIREIQEAFPERNRPAYTTVQTTVYRLEGKKAVRRVKKISNAHIFEAVVSRNVAQSRLIDELLGLFGGRTQPVMAHLIESGKLTLADVQEAEKALRRLSRKDKSQ
jgi:BlaI family transcriptional regulator, penicillinase repressor